MLEDMGSGCLGSCEFIDVMKFISCHGIVSINAKAKHNIFFFYIVRW